MSGDGPGSRDQRTVYGGPLPPATPSAAGAPPAGGLWGAQAPAAGDAPKDAAPPGAPAPGGAGPWDAFRPRPQGDPARPAEPDQSPQFPPSEPAPPQSAPLQPAQPQSAPPQPAQPPAAGETCLSVGDVLNNTYQVSRFIDRGGMGEVYEGFNIKDPEERVAIKVVLPSLSADAGVRALFDAEGRRMSRLARQHHPAIVRYIVSSEDPALRVLYMVTEYIDGTNLADVLDKVPRDAAGLTVLMRRLASGLAAAHQVGIYHLDLSPDNVMLEGGDIARAKIIDFGIGRDQQAGRRTVHGSGFQGKLRYVAPEQLGDFGFRLGPWTDVYGLALLMLAVAAGRDVDMGDTMVEAVDRRRALVDVSAAPDALQPLLARMLVADPDNRLGTMQGVLDTLDDLNGPRPRQREPELAPVGEVPDVAAPADPAVVRVRQPALPVWRRLPARAGVAAAAGAALLAAGVLGVVLLRGGADERRSPPPAQEPAKPPVERARAALAATVPNVPCAWLDLVSLDAAPAGRVKAAFRGVAGDKIAAQASISAALAQARVDVDTLTFDVKEVTRQACQQIDAYRPFRPAGAKMITAAQDAFELTEIDGERKAQPQVTVAAEAARQPFALGIIDPPPKSVLPVSLAEQSLVQSVQAYPTFGTVNADGSVTIKGSQVCAGMQGIFIIYGPTAVDDKLAVPLDSPADWPARFARAAQQGHWHVDMAWYEVVDPRQPAAGSAGPVACQP